MNTLKMVFPEGVELSTKPRRPAYKSCYIAIRDDSLEKHMLSFVLFSEQLPAEGVEAYNLNNFKLAKEVYADRAVGLVSKHHDNYTAEKVLRYILEYVSRDAVDTPVEVAESSAASHLQPHRRGARQGRPRDPLQSAARPARPEQALRAGEDRVYAAHAEHKRRSGSGRCPASRSCSA